MGIENVKMGPCNVSFNGNDLGLTLGGVEVIINVSVNDIPLLTDNYSNSNPVASSMEVSIICPLAETTFATLQAANPWSTVSADGKTLTLKDITGERLRSYAKPLVLTPIGYAESVRIPLALPRPSISHTYTNSGERITEINFLAIPGGDGTLIQFIDTSIQVIS